jgi:hypothetical protein
MEATITILVENTTIMDGLAGEYGLPVWSMLTDGRFWWMPAATKHYCPIAQNWVLI